MTSDVKRRQASLAHSERVSHSLCPVLVGKHDLNGYHAPPTFSQHLNLRLQVENPQNEPKRPSSCHYALLVDPCLVLMAASQHLCLPCFPLF